jgi:hypothetical protein
LRSPPNAAHKGVRKIRIVIRCEADLLELSLSSLARIPAPKDMMGYVQDLLWSSGELGRCICRRGWSKPEVWALAPATTPEAQILTDTASRVARTDDANEWLDAWIIAQGRATPNLCLVAHDPLAPAVDPDDDIFDSPGRWDTRGGESYLVLPKAVLAPGIVKCATRQMIGDQYALIVIEDEWPFGDTRSLESIAYGVRHVIVPITEGESYGIISGA